MVIGTNGVGYVAICPSIATDRVSALMTTATASDQLSQAPVNRLTFANYTAGEYTGLALPRLPFPSAGLTGVSSAISFGRIVSVGVRIQYTGKLVDRNGTYTCFHDPNHQNLAQLQYSTVRAQPAALTTPVGANPCEITLFAIDENEYDYPRRADVTTPDAIVGTYPFSQGVAQTGGWTGVGASPAFIYAIGDPGTTFDVQLIMNAEFIGSNTIGNTLNVADSRGFDIVTTALSSAQKMLETDSGRSFASTVSSAVTSAAKQMAASAISSGLQYTMKNSRTGRLSQIELR